MSNVLIPGWQTVIRDEYAQYDFNSVYQYIDNPDIQMQLIDGWHDIEFEDCESHLIFSFHTADIELAALLQNDSTWKFGINGWKDIGNGWFDVYPHSVSAETRAWLREKYGD